jgi:hypothetical protein
MAIEHDPSVVMDVKDFLYGVMSGGEHPEVDAVVAAALAREEQVAG